ncbi:hypothetical protein OF829_10565 [Sphingomonas sp. LB-2]|uniref:hypothetical protein n=1 Tax=Sphingomonas caeni TaxID=2984949 RepID=UPI00222EBDAB|nr:hypothetical protein [Sphingomonas caeni]MCW3847684.1 hypothetical protein [Sphingomonas caeni]
MTTSQPEPLPAQVKGDTLNAGTTVQLVWPASPGLTLVFDLIYNAIGNFSSVTLTPQAPSWGLPAQAESLPMQIETTSSTGQTIEISSSLTAARSPYAGAIRVTANTPDFVFEGEAVEFSANINGLDPSTVW